MPDLAERPIFGTESSDRFPTVTMDLVQRVAQAFPDIIYVYDVREARNIYCNREIASVLGYSPEEARDFGPNFFPSLLHPADADAVTAGHANLRSALDGDMVSLTYRMRHRDGSWRWLQSRDRVFARDSDSRVTQIMGIAHDATQEHRAKQELTEAVERYRSLVSLLADWVWECGPDGAYTYVSPQAADLLGYSPEELLGRHPCQFMTAEEAARVRPALELAVAARKPFKGVGHSMIGKDKRTVHLEVSGMPVFDSATRAWARLSRYQPRRHRAPLRRDRTRGDSCPRLAAGRSRLVDRTRQPVRVSAHSRENDPISRRHDAKERDGPAG